MTDPLVSIVIPTYRRPRLLRQALASAVGQTYKNLQIIVRDNASGDETPDVVRSFDDARIEFLQSMVTGIAYENSSEALKKVRGEYSMILSDDDILGANYVETLVRFLQQDKTILAAYGATSVIDENGAVTRKCMPDGTYTLQCKELIRAWCGATLPLSSGINYVCPTSFLKDVLIKVRRFPEGHHSDNAVFLAASIQGKVLFTNQCMFYYRDWGRNSWKRWACRIQAQGDRELLKFLDNQMRSDRNVGLPQTEWSGLRAALRSMLAQTYFAFFLQVRLDKANFSEMVYNAIQTYGMDSTMTFLRQHQHELQKKESNLLKLATVTANAYFAIKWRMIKLWHSVILPIALFPRNCWRRLYRAIKLGKKD